MHVLMISDVYFPRVNGVSTSIESFRRHLVDLGHRVTLLCPAYPDDQPGLRLGDEAESGIIRIPSRRVPLDPEDRLMHWRPLTSLGEAFAGADVDLVHVHTPFVAHYAGRRVADRLGVPLLETYHTFFEEYAGQYLPLVPRRWLRSLARRWSRAQCNATDHLIVPSAPMREALQHYGVQTGMTVLPTGIENEPPAPTEATEAFRRLHKIPAGAPLLLYVGRLAGEKNIDLLLDMLPDVLALHPDTILAIAGEGPARPRLERRVTGAGLGPSTRFIGYMQRDGELQAAYRAADLFVFASRSETQGLVLLEALDQGTPVVAIAEMGTRDVLDVEGGCVIAPNDPQDFAAAVIGLLEQPDRRRAMGSAARRYAQGWAARAMARRLVDLYRACGENFRR
ncbi:glycosyltransferase [Guyparkeria sp.]|uniref:glycosyltransferase n=1 Tax=Guyparkeria sp. TaxID=2035736 RepID=UPI0039708A60